MNLKPCPFCKGECLSETGKFYFIHHNSGCYLGAFTELPKDDEEWIDRWNTRATDPLLEEMADAIDDLLLEIDYNADMPNACKKAKNALQR